MKTMYFSRGDRGLLAASLSGVMPRWDDADRSRFLAGLLRDAIHWVSRNMTSRSSVPACWCMSTSMTSAAKRRVSAVNDAGLSVQLGHAI